MRSKRKDTEQRKKVYVLEKISQGWIPDVIEGCGEVKLSMSSRTLYRRLRDDSTLKVKELPIKRKRKKRIRGKARKTSIQKEPKI